MFQSIGSSIGSSFWSIEDGVVINGFAWFLRQMDSIVSRVFANPSPCNSVATCNNKFLPQSSPKYILYIYTYIVCVCVCVFVVVLYFVDLKMIVWGFKKKKKKKEEDWSDIVLIPPLQGKHSVLHASFQLHSYYVQRMS